MAEYSIKQKCPACKGTGTRTSTGTDAGGNQVSWSTPCKQCDETGSIEGGTITLEPGLEDILDKVNDVLDKVNDVLERLNE